MAATTEQPSSKSALILKSSDVIGQPADHVSTSPKIRFKDNVSTNNCKSANANTRPKEKTLIRKNTPATLPTVEKLNSQQMKGEIMLEEDEEEDEGVDHEYGKEQIDGATEVQGAIGGGPLP